MPLVCRSWKAITKFSGPDAQTQTAPNLLPASFGCAPAVVAVAPVGLLQALDAGVELLGAPQVAHAGHLLCDLHKYVAVVHAGLQAVLHVVRRPHLHQGHRLLVGPGDVGAV